MKATREMNISKKKSDKPIAVDLFSGCGGLTQGLKMAGFNVIGAVEIDHLSVETYKDNHKEVLVKKIDIKELDPVEFMQELDIEEGELDLLAGCPPCQGFSKMRTLNGGRAVEDPRNDLIKDFLRFVKIFKPKTVMMENVPGLADDKRFKNFCKDIKELGYIGKHSAFNAADYEVPQRRLRLIYLAGYKKHIPFAEKSEDVKTVRDVISKLEPAEKSGDRIHDFPENRTEKVKKLIEKIPKNGGSRTSLQDEDQLTCHKNCTGFKDVYGRMAWDVPAPTITSGCFNPSKGRFLHPVKNRAITMREAALLQGFPKSYKFNKGGKIAVAEMIGNALPPPFIAAHAGSIRSILLESS